MPDAPSECALCLEPIKPVDGKLTVNGVVCHSKCWDERARTRAQERARESERAEPRTDAHA